MGVPAFFRWLTRKYPSVIIECTERKQVDEATGKNIYEDASLPNPNDIEFDNLYLDMNGIIHPCTHPEDKPPPRDEDEMMVAIFDCIDRLMSIVRPRKVLYMAIDGVAPRAKMNQQRSRRFRASKEAAEKATEVARIREELKTKGAILPPEKPKEHHFDSNCITPGTPFMQRLSRCLQYYIHDRLNNNPGWKNIKVILSDANVPGEGEHKIMDYIRKQRSQPDHDPNTQHVLCGADADLIMLGLATHEPNFTIIREEFLPNKPRPCDICSQIGHEMKDCTGLDIAYNAQPDTAFGKETQFIFVRLNVLKEYLERELDMPNLPFPYDFERVIDDWVFMCFFVGNDFLPHLPSLEIRENAIDRLIGLYKKCVYKTGGYLTDSGDVALERVEMIMRDLGHVEDEIFQDRQKNEERMKARNKRMKLEKQRRPDFSSLHNTQFAPTPLGQQPTKIVNPHQEILRIGRAGIHSNVGSDNRNADLEAMLHPSSDQSQQQSNRGEKRRAEKEPAEEEDEQAHDEVRLWEDGFKDRYYESKFDVLPENIQFRYSVALQYVKGLCWVLQYYYQGCASWEWYFPYHYAPFASDFINISGLSKKFSYGKPFRPLDQLMGVFPAASRQHVPLVFAKLMLDPESPIIDFYPEDFNIDLNGKKFAWQGVALLPFVDEQRLFKACKPFEDQLTLEEQKRNKNGENYLYLGTGCSGYRLMKKFYEEANDEADERDMPISVDGMQGLVRKYDDNVEEGGTFQSCVRGLHDVTDNTVISVKFLDPVYPEGFIFPAKRLENATEPPKVLKQQSDQNNRNYRPVIGFNHHRTDFANVGDSGRRMVNHHTNSHHTNNRYNDNGGYGNQRNQHQQYQSGGSGGGGGGGYHQQRSNTQSNFNNYSSSGASSVNQYSRSSQQYSQAAPPSNYNSQQPQRQQSSNYSSSSNNSNRYNSASNSSRPPYQTHQSQGGGGGGQATGGYAQWKAQRSAGGGGSSGSYQSQGNQQQQQNRGGYQRFDPSNNQRSGNGSSSSSSRYGGSYSR